MDEDKQDQSLFVVKGKPKINFGIDTSYNKSNLETILKQKLEEIKEKQKSEHKLFIGHPGSEFKPENVPYIPDIKSPLLDKHDTATPVRNAGFQDRAQVPSMYLENIKKESKAEIIPGIAKEVYEFAETTKDVKEEVKPKDKEFELKIARENMHKGGFHFSGEYKPYRPGS